MPLIIIPFLVRFMPEQPVSGVIILSEQKAPVGVGWFSYADIHG
jgi:hypothetical protein